MTDKRVGSIKWLKCRRYCISLLLDSLLSLWFAPPPVSAANPPTAQEIVGKWEGTDRQIRGDIGEVHYDFVNHDWGVKKEPLKTNKVTFVIKSNGTSTWAEGESSGVMNYQYSNGKIIFNQESVTDIKYEGEIQHASSGLSTVIKMIVYVKNTEPYVKSIITATKASGENSVTVLQPTANVTTSPPPQSSATNNIPSAVATPPAATVTGNVPGLGSVGSVPGPATTTQAAVGLLLPALLGILGSLLSAAVGGLPGSATSQPPPVEPAGPVDEEKQVIQGTTDGRDIILPTEPQPEQSPPDIEYTYPDGKRTVLVFNPEHGGYINQLTGGRVNPSDIEGWKQNNEKIESNIDEWRAKNAQQQELDREAARKSIEEEAKKRADENNEDQLRNRMINTLKHDKNISDMVDMYVATNDLAGLKSIYRDKLQDQIDTGAKDAAYYDRVATAWGVAETAARVTVTASKAALITIGGPAGMAVTSTTVGAVSAAQEGAESYVRGDRLGEVVTRTAGGFLSGAKDGAIGVYTNMPGVSKAAKYLVPAAADTADTYIRTTIDNPDNLSQSEIMKRVAGAGLLSIASDFAGGKVDMIQTVAAREVAKAGLSGLSGGVSSFIQGGTFGQGLQPGLEGYVGGKIGGHLGSTAANNARTGTEKTVHAAINEVAKQKIEKIKVIDVDKQSEIVQDMAKEVWEIKKDNASSGKDNDVVYVDENKTLEQLRDTQSSRTAKQAPKAVQDAIINTRADKIYRPADEATICKAYVKLTEAGMLQPGDKLKMDTFSTPGKPPSLGADRDARLVIERTNPATGETEKIEVDRKHWENDAYKDFYEHTTKIAGGEQAITPEAHPDFHKRVEELQYLKGAGFTDEQIKHRAWAEAHNQLFTDKSHVEASADNSDQLREFVDGKMTTGQKLDEKGRGLSNVQEVQKGDEKLLDPAGYARMWEEKSQVYARMGNQPEAIAQSQKGIEQYMKLREGYHAQGYEVPPLDTRTAKAMEIITRAPVGVDATPEAIAHVEQQLKGHGFRDTNNALGKIATQNEVLKFSKPRPELGTGMLSRLGRDAPHPDSV